MAADRLRDDVLHLLQGGNAHVQFEKVVGNLPEPLRGKVPRGLPYSAWQLLEHIRITQWDILEYIRSAAHVSPEWPEGYWPNDPEPTRTGWSKSAKAFQADRQVLVDLARSGDLLARVPHEADGPTLLHELLLVADHTAYHLGEMVVLRRILGAWEP